MIYVLCSGGLGNQMFQYAYLMHLEANGNNVTLDTSYFAHHDIHAGYGLERAFGIAGKDKPDHFNQIWKLKYSLLARTSMNRLGRIHMEKSGSPIDEMRLGNNAVLYGYWQGEQFFSDVKKEVRDCFSFTNIPNETLILGDQIAHESSVAVHIRRGDYLKNPKYMNLSSTNYYKNAIAAVRDKISNPQFYIFSDDIIWCKESGLFEGATYVDFTKEAHEDMYLMTRARGIVIANSSFSWWAGYLGDHEVVIRPEKYLVNWTAEQDERLFPKEWIIGRFEG